MRILFRQYARETWLNKKLVEKGYVCTAVGIRGSGILSHDSREDHFPFRTSGIGMGAVDASVRWTLGRSSMELQATA